jgi:hypothetical protein
MRVTPAFLSRDCEGAVRSLFQHPLQPVVRTTAYFRAATRTSPLGVPAREEQLLLP